MISKSLRFILGSFRFRVKARVVEQDSVKVADIERHGRGPGEIAKKS